MCSLHISSPIRQIPSIYSFPFLLGGVAGSSSFALLDEVWRQCRALGGRQTQCQTELGEVVALRFVGLRTGGQWEREREAARLRRASPQRERPRARCRQSRPRPKRECGECAERVQRECWRVSPRTLPERECRESAISAGPLLCPFAASIILQWELPE